jgi:hypothetical protein
MLPRLRRDLDSLFKLTVYRNTILDPSPGFLDICSRSRFILAGGNGIVASLHFLAKLPQKMRPHIRDIAILRDNLWEANTHNRVAWEPKWVHGKGRTRVTDFLRHALNLDALALYVPTIGEERHYCEYAPEAVCKMLADGTINVVRFIYQCSLGASPRNSCSFLRDIVGTVRRAIMAASGFCRCQ